MVLSIFRLSIKVRAPYLPKFPKSHSNSTVAFCEATGMRPCFATIWLALFGVMSGCVTTSDAHQRFALFKPPAADKDQAGKDKKESKPTAEERLAKSHNPFRKETAAKTASESKESSAEKTANAKSENSSKETAKTAADTGTTNKTAAAAGAFNPETLRLIDAELADASADERAYWYDQLKQVDPAVIPKILQARRLTAEIVEQRQQDSTPFNETTSAERAGNLRDRGVQQTKSDDWTRNDPAVVNAVGRKFPGDPANLNQALHETDGLSMRQPIAQQGYAPPDQVTGKPFAVQRASEPAAAPPSRNPLSRLLPSGRTSHNGTGTVTQASANAPAAVSLMPPTELDEFATWQSQLDPLISLVESEVAQLKPGNTEESQTDYIQRHVYLRMLYLMAQHPERALTAIPGIDSSDQEFWQQMLWSMTNYFDVEHLPDAKDRAGQAAAQLATATQRLREQADLEIRNLAFCREIVYYGNYVRFPRDEFHPGDPVLLYAEIENFKSDLTVDGQYRTLIRSTVEILSPSGEVRWHKEFPAPQDLCANYRRDYFLNFQFDISDRLPIGPHVLKLTAFDELSGKMVSQSINFVVR